MFGLNYWGVAVLSLACQAHEPVGPITPDQYLVDFLVEIWFCFKFCPPPCPKSIFQFRDEPEGAGVTVTLTHIVVETVEGNLSAGMRQLNGVYTISLYTSPQLLKLA